MRKWCRWWRFNDYARKRARMLAQEGYTALALDMFTSAPSQASAMSRHSPAP